jgi:hypothetical protein
MGNRGHQLAKKQREPVPLSDAKFEAIKAKRLGLPVPVVEKKDKTQSQKQKPKQHQKQKPQMQKRKGLAEGDLPLQPVNKKARSKKMNKKMAAMEAIVEEEKPIDDEIIAIQEGEEEVIEQDIIDEANLDSDLEDIEESEELVFEDDASDVESLGALEEDAETLVCQMCINCVVILSF